MPIPTFKFNNLTRTDVLQFDGVNFVNVPVYAVGRNVMWGPEGVGYNSLIVGDVTKNIPLVGHKHTANDILGLQELINDLGVNSNSGTNTDLSNYLLISTFTDHLNNNNSAKHVTQAHLDKLNNYWHLDDQGNLYTTYNTYSTKGLSAFGLGEDGGGNGTGGGGVDMLDSWANYTEAKANFYAPASLLVPFRNDILSRLTSLESGGGGGDGSVTSVGLSVPTGLSVTGSPIVSSGTLAISFASGYSIPTTAKQANWDSTYNHIQTFDDMFEKVEVSTGVYAIKAKYDFYSIGDVSAYGLGSGGSGGGTEYILPVASASTLGGIKVGTGLTISSGVLSVVGGGGGGSTVTWGTESSGYIPLIVEGVSKSIALSTHTHSWSQITGKPSTFTPSTHSHTKSQITDFPTTWAWGSLTGVPSTFTPSSHSHSWTEITSKPSTFAPSAHTHTSAQISDATSLNTASMIVKRNSSGNFSAGTITASLSGNASSATQLQTARTIWGQSFNGIGNVSGALTGVTSISMNNALTGATTIEALTSITTPKVIFKTAGWSMEESTEGVLELKYNGVVKQKFLDDGSIAATGELTAYVAGASGYSDFLPLSGGTLTGNLNISATLTATTMKVGSNDVLHKGNIGSAGITSIGLGNGWTIEQTATNLYIKKNGEIKGTFNA